MRDLQEREYTAASKTRQGPLRLPRFQVPVQLDHGAAEPHVDHRDAEAVILRSTLKMGNRVQVANPLRFGAASAAAAAGWSSPIAVPGPRGRTRSEANQSKVSR